MVKKAEIYSGEIPDMPGPESALFGKAHFILRDAIKILKRVLHGSHVPLKKYQVYKFYRLYALVFFYLLLILLLLECFR